MVNQFVDNQGNNTVSVVDTMTNTIVATISVGRGPSKIAITPDGTRAYVPNQQDFIISVIDTATNTVVTTIPVSGTAGIAITPDGTKAYVTSPGAGTVSVVDIATNTVVATILLGTNQNPFDVAITPDGTRAYVTINSPNVRCRHRYRDQHGGCNHFCGSGSGWGSRHARWNPSLRDER